MGEDRRERVWSPEFRDELSEMVRLSILMSWAVRQAFGDYG